MKVDYHPAVQRDVSSILRYYDGIDEKLADDFWAELNWFIRKAAADPVRFHFVAPGRRRVNLKRFPYHFLFRQTAEGIRVTAARHDKQHPQRGLRRP